MPLHNSRAHHALFRTARFPGYLQMARNWRASPLTFCLGGDQFRPRLDFWRAVSVPRNRRSRRPHRRMRVVSTNADLETKHLPLARPLRGQVAHPRHAMAVPEAPFDRGLDEGTRLRLGREACGDGGWQGGLARLRAHHIYRRAKRDGIKSVQV